MKKIVALCLVACALLAMPATAFARSHFSFSMNLFPAAPMFMPAPQPVVVVSPPRYFVPAYQQRTIVHEYHQFNGCPCGPQQMIVEEVRVCPPPSPVYRYMY